MKQTYYEIERFSTNLPDLGLKESSTWLYCVTCFLAKDAKEWLRRYRKSGQKVRAIKVTRETVKIKDL